MPRYYDLIENSLKINSGWDSAQVDGICDTGLSYTDINGYAEFYPTASCKVGFISGFKISAFKTNLSGYFAATSKNTIKIIINSEIMALANTPRDNNDMYFENEQTPTFWALRYSQEHFNNCYTRVEFKLGGIFGNQNTNYDRLWRIYFNYEHKISNIIPQKLRNIGGVSFLKVKSIGGRSQISGDGDVAA